MKNKINTLVIVIGMIIGALYAPAMVYAETGTEFNRDVDTTNTGKDTNLDRDVNTNTNNNSSYCGGVKIENGQSCVNGVVTSVIKCDGTNNGKIEDSCVWSLLTTVINIMTAGIGLLAVGGVVYGSILYASAGGSMDQTKQAIKIIQNVIIGLVAYTFMYAFLNYVIPGGLF